METLNLETELSTLTYYRLGGVASEVFLPQSISSLQNWLVKNFPQSKPVAVLGCGSNVVFSDLPFNGTVVSCRNLTSWHWLSEGALYCEAGVTNTELSEIGLEAGFSDAAWLFRMPGQLGATVRMNARCYGGEISEIVTDVYTFTLKGEAKHYKSENLFKGYKDTELMRQKEIVFAAVIKFHKPEAFDEILATMKSNEADRHRKQHFLYPSCGSTFKNNHAIGKPSGRIFEELGLKGTQRGQAQISEYHGNFVYNKGHATAHDVLELARLMRIAALQQEMQLELEVQPIGLFDVDLARDLALCSLDTSTTQVSETMVLTGVLWNALNEKSQTPSDREPAPLATTIVCPFVGWNRDTSLNLGHTQFMISHVDFKKEGTETLKIVFLAESAEHLKKLLSAPPPKPGFQDKLWESSVFECFVFSKNSEKYLELEIHDRNSWLALKFDSYRQRNRESLTPTEADFSGIRPFEVLADSQLRYARRAQGSKDLMTTQTIDFIKAKHEDPAIGLGFEISLNFLEKLFGKESLQLELRGAYAHGPKKCYAIAPGRGNRVEFLEDNPDFHQRRGAVLIFAR